MNVFFDMDYTILGGIDGSLRPGTLEVFEELAGLGHDLYIWSGVGVRWGEVRRFGLEPFVKGVYCKPLSEFDEGLDRFGIPVVPDFVIDDYPGIVRHFGGYCIKEYICRVTNDEEMYTIRAQIDSYLERRAAPTTVEGPA
jgi:hypothetical protein